MNEPQKKFKCEYSDGNTENFATDSVGSVVT